MTHSSERDRVARAVRALAAGERIVLVDERGAGRGDVVVAAQIISGDDVNFMAKHARGLVCLALSAERVAHLRLPPMVARFGEGEHAATRSVEAKHGITTGISASERAHTLRTASSPAARPEDLIAPGHVLPLRGADGFTPARLGRVEAAIALARLAGFTEAAALCTILDEAGDVAGTHALSAFADTHGLVAVTIAEVLTVANEAAARDPAFARKSA